MVEGGEDAGVVQVLGQVRRDGREPVGEAGDGLAGDREVLQVRLGLPQPGLQAVDLCAEAVGQGPSGVFLVVQGIERGPDVHCGWFVGPVGLVGDDEHRPFLGQLADERQYGHVRSGTGPPHRRSRRASFRALACGCGSLLIRSVTGHSSSCSAAKPSSDLRRVP